ncbi:MAG: dihydrolipoyl dehydrogenase [Chloroflexi bacterium]|nr:dihydrolipoyl dehydrogenase [Chloroflexota bacterium]
MSDQTTSSPYDLIVVGGGPGGYVAAIRARQLGARVALVEMERIGGTCLNRGCIPTKAMVAQAELYLEMQRAAEFGIDVDGEIRVNFPRMMARKDEVTETLVRGVEELVRAQGVDVYPGVGQLVAPGRVQVTPLPGSEQAEVTLEGRKVILATGSDAAQVPIPGVDLPGVVTSRELLRLTEQPKAMVVIGASVVGMEFASIFHALGTKVTVIGRKTFLKDADPQLAKRFRTMIKRDGIDVTIGVEFRQIVQTDDGRLQVEWEQKGKVDSAVGDLVLLSTGRNPYTEGLGLQALGVAMKGRSIAVNERLETSLPGVYSIGDVSSPHQLAHVASYEGEIAVQNALGGAHTVDYHAVPGCIFTIPELASVGLTEEQATEQGIACEVARFPYSVNGRALGMGQTEGQIRLVVEQESGVLLGMHVMGAHASDIIAEGALAIQQRLTAKEVAETIHAHPTIPEIVMEAAKAAAFGEAIHYRKVR